MVLFFTPSLPIRIHFPLHVSNSSLSSVHAPKMSSLSRPQSKMPPSVTPSAPPCSIPTAPELAAISSTICEFMNKERLRDVAQYVVKFGSHFDDLAQLSDVRMTGLDAMGFTADVVSCDESDCVCVQERLTWPDGSVCTDGEDVINALKCLSEACGLPTDF